jgi:predicted acetyltransferase
VASGSLRFVGLEQARELLPALQERVRLLSPGAIEPWPMYWDNRLGLVGDDKEPAKKLLVVRYDSPAGELEGIGVYKVSDVEGDLFGHTLEVTYLVTATDEAAAGLWRFFLDADLVSTVTARQRPVDDSIVWQVSDFRGARKTGERDHLWTRILDVPAALQARGYADSAVIALDVTDPLGFAAGSFTLRVTPDGVGVVTTGAAADATAHAALTVNALSSLYLGGVSAETLVRAGRITEVVPGSAAVIDSVFRSPVTPWLSIWF